MSTFKGIGKVVISLVCVIISWVFAKLSCLFKSNTRLAYIAIWFMQKTYDFANKPMRELMLEEYWFIKLVNLGYLKV